MSSKRLALGLLATISPLVTATLFWESLYSELLLVLASVVFPSALMTIAQPSGETRCRARAWCARLPLLLALLLSLSSGAIILSHGYELGCGLPLPAVFEVLGLWLIPLPVVVIAYLRAFDHEILPEDALEGLRHRYGTKR